MSTGIEQDFGNERSSTDAKESVKVNLSNRLTGIRCDVSGLKVTAFFVVDIDATALQLK